MKYYVHLLSNRMNLLYCSLPQSTGQVPIIAQAATTRFYSENP